MVFPSNPYPIYGFITNSNGVPIAGATVRIENQTTSEYEDVSTANDGSYLSDLSNLPSGYSSGDSIKVLCYSVYRIIQVDLISFENGRRVDISAYLNFLVNDVAITDVISIEVGRSLGERVWTATVDLENISGYRTNSFQIFDGIQIDINGITILKGRINISTVNKQNHLFVGGENFSAYLNDRVVQSESYVATSIYDIITTPVTGLIPKYLPSVTMANVANDANTQQLITKTFEKQTVMECLQYLASVASEGGYDFYIDNSKDLHFVEHKTIDSGVILTNVGASKNVLSWDWKDKEGKDIFNKILVYYGVGGAASVERNDLDSQAEYGIREHPPITDENVSTVAEANALGDRTLNKYSNFYREGTITCMATDEILDLYPGELVSLELANSGISGSTFPIYFPILFGGSYIVMEVKHKFPKFTSEIRVSEYQKDLTSILTNVLRNTEDSRIA